MTAKDRELTFEERIEALEKLVASMEEGGMRLDETLAAYEQGMKLAAKLHEELMAGVDDSALRLMSARRAVEKLGMTQAEAEEVFGVTFPPQAP